MLVALVLGLVIVGSVVGGALLNKSGPPPDPTYVVTKTIAVVESCQEVQESNGTKSIFRNIRLANADSAPLTFTMAHRAQNGSDAVISTREVRSNRSALVSTKSTGPQLDQSILVMATGHGVLYIHVANAC